MSHGKRKTSEFYERNVRGFHSVTHREACWFFGNILIRLSCKVLQSCMIKLLFIAGSERLSKKQAHISYSYRKVVKVGTLNPEAATRAVL